MGQDVKAAQCSKSAFGRWRCSPCGRGTRCSFCNWCLGYCYNKDPKQRSLQNETDEFGDTEVPYKLPFIQMFEDLVTLIEKDDISDIDVVELYKVTFYVLREDCMLCDNSKEIGELKKQVKLTHRKLKELLKSKGITVEDEFKKTALQKTRETLIITDKIPANLTAKVDSNSTIAIATTSTKGTPVY